MHISFDWLLAVAALPKVGLPAIFIISFISATLIPTGSEPAVFAYIKLNPTMIWPTILVASLGNIAGGMFDWWLGYGAKVALFKFRLKRVTEKNNNSKKKNYNGRIVKYMHKHGAKVLLFSWLPIVGDPLCVVAGWLRLSWQSCLLYMSIGKFLRYVIVTYLLMAIPQNFWLKSWEKISKTLMITRSNELFSYSA